MIRCTTIWIRYAFFKITLVRNFIYDKITKMKKFTQYQIQEIIPLIEIRRDTIQEDQESAYGPETVEWLDSLEAKIQSNTMDFTDEEKEWLIEELETRINVGNGNKGHGQDLQILSFINSMNNAISKV